ncbi:hypothetical protein ACIRJR_09550 [Streptomyces sp. NPDC102402]|uniref:hypothetical protein n=1 Tax=Streptomyces sp. NPDC102402 TaxID=3366169 RepID=UPI003830BA76
MTTETTDSTLTLSTAPRPGQMDALMHALAVAEEAVSVLKITMPTDVSLSENGAVYDVSLYFPQQPERVTEFANAWESHVDHVPHHSREDAEFLEVTITIRGIRVRAWTIPETTAAAESTGGAA